MDQIRNIDGVNFSRPTIEGAGVRLKRAFGSLEAPLFDPFLMLDDFRSDNPVFYTKGFPWHPHRGIETITYVLEGNVEHRDSLGNQGVISAGDVQWMTAGSGIIHQEMPEGSRRGALQGFQLWANLPSMHKMRDPRYQDIRSGDVPTVRTGEGVYVRLICGRLAGERGPVRGIVTDPEYLDVAVTAGRTFEHSIKRGYRAVAYVISGSGYFDSSRDQPVGNEGLVLYGDGDAIRVSAETEAVRFLLLSGRPIGEPVAWQGPIVMNTHEELQTAFREYDQGTFIKNRSRPSTPDGDGTRHAA